MARYTKNDSDPQNGHFQVIELGGSNQIDLVASGMTHFHFDAWFSEEVTANSGILLKLVDIIAGDPATVTEAQINLSSTSTPSMVQGQWISFDYTLAELSSLGMTNQNNV